MITKTTEKSVDRFISEDESNFRYNTPDACGNYEIVTRTKWVKLWKFWIPFARRTRMIKVNNMLGYYALGRSADFNPCFDKKYKI